MEKTMIEIYRDDKKELVIFKARTNAKNMPETMKFIVKQLNKEVDKK